MFRGLLGSGSFVVRKMKEFTNFSITIIKNTIFTKPMLVSFFKVYKDLIQATQNMIYTFLRKAWQTWSLKPLFCTFVWLVKLLIIVKKIFKFYNRILNNFFLKTHHCKNIGWNIMKLEENEGSYFDKCRLHILQTVFAKVLEARKSDI